jgi:hypothetical protein
MVLVLPTDVLFDSGKTKINSASAGVRGSRVVSAQSRGTDFSDRRSAMLPKPNARAA